MRIDGTETLPALSWRIRIMMAEREIKTVTALQARLRDVGIEVSTQFLSRVVSRPPARINIALLQGLAEVLSCDIGDLIRRAEPHRVTEPAHVKEPADKRTRRLRESGQTSESNVRKLLGPITPLDPEYRPKSDKSS